MGFENYSTAEPTIDEGMKSKFNEAFLKMHRLHKLQDTMNFCEMNLLMFNDNADAFNYQIKIRNCNALLFEIWGKLTDKERDEVMRLKNAIKRFNKIHPIHSNKKDNINGKTILRMDDETWNILENAIEKYEFKIRELMTRTGYDSPDKDEWDEDSL